MGLRSGCQQPLHGGPPSRWASAPARRFPRDCAAGGRCRRRGGSRPAVAEVGDEAVMHRRAAVVLRPDVAAAPRQWKVSSSSQITCSQTRSPVSRRPVSSMQAPASPRPVPAAAPPAGIAHTRRQQRETDLDIIQLDLAGRGPVGPVMEPFLQVPSSGTPAEPQGLQDPQDRVLAAAVGQVLGNALGVGIECGRKKHGRLSVSL